MDIAEIVTQELGIRRKQADAVISLIDEGNTIPFIARYRKEMTGGMNDEVLRKFDERLKYLRNLQDRKETVLSSIEEQGKLTEELRAKIDAVLTASALEDLYRPYRPKRRTRAMIAKERGLEGLADFLCSRKAAVDPETEALKYVHPEKDVPDADAALAGAKDIIAEKISDNADERDWIRRKTLRDGNIVSVLNEKPAKASAGKTGRDTGNESARKGKNAGQDEDSENAARMSVYENYFNYTEPLSRIPGHRILALNRGEQEKILTVKVEAPEDEIIRYLENHEHAQNNKLTEPYLKAAIRDAYKRLIAPSIETEIRNSLTEKAEDGAIEVFGKNLKQLLMQPPIAGKTVLGWDPAFRTGCKISVVDPTGKVLDTAVIFPTAPQNKVKESMAVIEKLVRKDHVDIISLGNGTASRESEKIIVDFIKQSHLPLQYVIVNEAGASVYSASKLATEEFPNFDVGQRSATSMARRLQDPLAELVKIDPKSVGVGQYQHDMDQGKLSGQLNAVVEDCVNTVGVDVNTASFPLLVYVSGINKTTAKNIVAYREENGSFRSRRELLKVPKLGPKAYEQCAGFLRIRGGREVLDSTSVHPESYPAAKALLEYLGYTSGDVRSGKTADIENRMKEKNTDIPGLSAKLEIGEYTLSDIIEELKRPGRDPREDIPAPVLRSDVMELSDLKPGMILTGTVRNVIDFGAFVDIGVHQDGLVHISQLSDRYVAHPLDVVQVGDIVRVKVLSVDEGKKRISLTMKEVPQK